MSGFKILKCVSAAVVALVGLQAQAQADLPRYRVEAFGGFDIYGHTDGVDLNNRGQVVFYGRPGGVVTPFLYQRGDVTPLSGLDGFGIQGMNDRGDFAGSMRVGGHVVPMLYRNGQFIDLSPTGIAGSGAAFSINQAGHVGGYYLTGGSNFQGLYYDGKQTHLVPDALGFTGINDHDVLVNAAGFVYDHGNFDYVPVLGSGFGAGIPVALNNAGQVVGRAYQEGSISVTAPFLYSNGVVQNLGNLGGSTGAAQDINNRGWVVGQAMDAKGDFEAFVYLDGAMHNVEDLLGARDRGQWDFLSASKINDRGQILVSVRDSPTGNFLNAVLTPVPEPLSSVLMLAGLGVIGLVKGAKGRRGPGLSGC